MKTKIVLWTVLLMLLASTAFANPILVKSIISDSWTPLLLIDSDVRGETYIPEDMINMNLYWTKYPENGNFTFVVYTKPDDQKFRLKIVDQIKAGIDNGTVITLGAAAPSKLMFIGTEMYFDMQNRRVKSTRERYIDRDGYLIGYRDIITGTDGSDVELNGTRPYFEKLANMLARILENAK